MKIKALSPRAEVANRLRGCAMYVVRLRYVHGNIQQPTSGRLKSFPNAFDNQVLTSTRITAWVGIDLGKQTKIKTMRFLTRTDDNGITPGHHYELLYYSENGWKTIKEKEATEDYLEFESVPSEALYWLKDLTEGKEERIFSYENGIVRFW